MLGDKIGQQGVFRTGLCEMCYQHRYQYLKKMNLEKPTTALSKFVLHIVFHRTICLILSPVMI